MEHVIFLTGASTGIGFDTVRALVEKGFRVVATVRNSQDAKKLQECFSERVHVLILDVTDQGQVESLPEQLRNLGIQRLEGLVNNAGVAFAGPFLHQPFSEIESILQVNVVSLLKITQVLLPLLGAFQGSNHPGRIVNISSIAGQDGTPFLSTYSASKHAVEGFSKSLRKELMLFGIRVIVIGPGSIKTPIWQKGFNQIKDKYKETAYGRSFAKFVSMANKSEAQGYDVDRVSRLVVHAFMDRDPCDRYAPVPKKWSSVILPSLMPARLLDKMTAKILGLDRASS